MHVRASRFLASAAAVAAAASIAAQPLDRLTGKVVSAAGAPVAAADVRVEAIFGFAGGDFLGQRTFAARTNVTGEWALLAFKSGIWMFDVAAPGQLPDAVALPFNLVAPASSGIDRLTPAWHPLLRLSPAPGGDIGQILADATEAALAQRADRVTPLLSRLADSNDPAVLAAAGSVCLLMREPTLARPLFRRALEHDPTSFRATLGMGSSALMQRNVDEAAKAFAQARALTKDKDERGYLSAAILELNKAHNVMRATY
jgi:tetratricopeptide (TPR) repeat protein